MEIMALYDFDFENVFSPNNNGFEYNAILKADQYLNIIKEIKDMRLNVVEAIQKKDFFVKDNKKFVHPSLDIKINSNPEMIYKIFSNDKLKENNFYVSGAMGNIVFSNKDKSVTSFDKIKSLYDGYSQSMGYTKMDNPDYFKINTVFMTGNSGVKDFDDIKISHGLYMSPENNLVSKIKNKVFKTYVDLLK